MKFEYSNDVLTVTADGKRISLSLKDEQFSISISKENVKKAFRLLLDSVEKNKKD